MGLLDSLLSDPDSSGLLGAGAAMFNASGPSVMPRSLGQIIGAGLTGAQQGMNSAQDQQGRQLEMVSKKIALQQAMAKMALIQQLTGAQQPDQGQDASSQPAIAPPSNMPMGSGFSGMAPPQPGDGQQASQPPMVSAANGNKIRAMMGLSLMDGKINDAYGMQKDLMTGYALDPGKFRVDPATGKINYIGDPTKGLTQDANGNVSAMPGFAQATADIAGATTAAQEAAKSNFTPVTFTPPGADSHPVTMTQAQHLSLLRGGPQPGGPYQPSAPQADPSQGPQGLDLSKVDPRMLAYMAKQNPQALARGASDFQQTSASAPAPANAQPQQASVPYSPQGGMGGIALQSPAEAADAMDQVKLKNAPKLAAATTQANANVDLQMKPQMDFRAKYEPELNSQLDDAQKIQRQMSILSTLADKIRMGGGSSNRAELAQLSENLPFSSPKLTNFIAGGNLADTQLFNKVASQETMSLMQQAAQQDNGAGGKTNKTMLQYFIDHNLNVDSQKNALNSMKALSDNLAAQTMEKSNRYYKNLATPGYDVTQFPNEWANYQQKQGYLKPDVPGASAAPASPTNAGPKTATLADIAATAKASGKTTAQVTAALKAKGYTIGGM